MFISNYEKQIINDHFNLIKENIINLSKIAKTEHENIKMIIEINNKQMDIIERLRERVEQLEAKRMKETELYEELLSEIIAKKLYIKLEGLKIIIFGRKNIDKNTLESIIKIVNRRNAKLTLLPYGQLEIKF